MMNDEEIKQCYQQLPKPHPSHELDKQVLRLAQQHITPRYPAEKRGLALAASLAIIGFFILALIPTNQIPEPTIASYPMVTPKPVITPTAYLMSFQIVVSEPKDTMPNQSSSTTCECNIYGLISQSQPNYPQLNHQLLEHKQHLCQVATLVRSLPRSPLAINLAISATGKIADITFDNVTLVHQPPPEMIALFEQWQFKPTQQGGEIKISFISHNHHCKIINIIQ